MDEQELRAIAIKQYEELESAGAKPWQMLVVGTTLISITIGRVKGSVLVMLESSSKIRELVSEYLDEGAEE